MDVARSLQRKDATRDKYTRGLFVGSVSDPGDPAELVHAKEAIYDCLSRMPPKQCAAVRISLLDNYFTSEIQSSLALESPGVAKANLDRGFLFLRECLRKKGIVI